MGNSGSKLDADPYKWETVNYIEGYKVLREKSTKSQSLPKFSHSPSQTYILCYNDGTIKQIRIYNNDKSTKLDIDYHFIDGKKVLHYHKFINNAREKEHNIFTEENEIYKKYKYIIDNYMVMEKTND